MANYNFEKTVLDMHSFYYTLPCQVTNTGLTADSNGKKLLKLVHQLVAILTLY